MPKTTNLQGYYFWVTGFTCGESFLPQIAQITQIIFASQKDYYNWHNIKSV
jgi:hypothetical protein